MNQALCSTCGEPSGEGKFCSSCGTVIDAKTDPPQVQSQPASASPPGSEFELVCISGPDSGKRVQLGTQAITVGSSAEAGLLSDDPDVVGQHARLSLDRETLKVESVGGNVFVDGIAVSAGIIGLRRQLRIGRSTWQFQRHGFDFARNINAKGVIDSFSQRVIGSMDDERARKTDDDIEEIFIAGTSGTTPPLMDVNAVWPKPWLFAKILFSITGIFLLFLFAFQEFQNIYLIPGLIMVGSLAVPVAVVVLFFEWNIPRNVSMYQVAKVFAVGGIVSLMASLFVYRLTGLESWMGASSAGLVEEAGKVLAVLIVANKVRYKWTLNGLLFGGAVGAGFAVFESAGYAFLTLLASQGDMEATVGNIVLRGIFAPGGHVAWSALIGAALWKVKGDRKFEFAMLTDPRFVRVFVFVAVLHAIWNSPWGTEHVVLKLILLVVVAWFAVMAFVADGIAQVKKAKEAEA